MYGMIMPTSFHFQLRNGHRLGTNSTNGPIDSTTALAVSCSVIGFVVVYVAVVCMVDALKRRRDRSGQSERAGTRRLDQSQSKGNRVGGHKAYCHRSRGGADSRESEAKMFVNQAYDIFSDEEKRLEQDPYFVCNYKNESEQQRQAASSQNQKAEQSTTKSRLCHLSDDASKFCKIDGQKASAYSRTAHLTRTAFQHSVIDLRLTKEVWYFVLSGGPLLEDTEYELSEIRFHWGKDCDRGSEHLINHKAFPMEIQFVHWNSRLYSSIEEAVGARHGIAIVAMFGQIGREHTGLKIVADTLEDVLYKGRQKTLSGPFNPSTFLPDPALWDYWTYEGSLTTPPCSENVTWIVLRYPLMMSLPQMENFRRLCTFVKGDHPHPGDDGFMADNFRPPQPLNGRIVRASFQS